MHEWVTATANTNNAVFRMFHSNAIQRPVSHHIHLPVTYTNEPARRFPVIYWLHGSGAGVNGVAPISQLYNNAMNLGLMPPTIMVFANGLPNGMWCDSKNGYQELAGIGHDPLQTLTGIGPANWQFYRSVIGVIP